MAHGAHLISKAQGAISVWVVKMGGLRAKGVGGI